MTTFVRPATLATTLFALACIASTSASAQSGGITSHKLDPAAAREAFGGGEPVGPFLTRMPLADPSAFEAASTAAPGSAIGGTPGVSGEAVSEGADAPSAFGTSTAPYTTARVAVTKPTESRKKAQIPVTSRPYSATGKLYITFGNQVFVCTASLVRKGVLVTAAHCVSDFGQGSAGMATAAIWYPSQFSGKKKGQPFGGFEAINVFVPTPYLDGTDTCTQTGVVCNNDIATIALKKQKFSYKNAKGKTKKVNKYPGQVLGTYQYGYNGYSYTAAPFMGGTHTVQITQLGYPVAFDSGYQMIRTDAVGWYFVDGNLRNTRIGSAQTGGSSGGPWLANFGTRPGVNTAQASLGAYAAPNVVVGVTSYGAVAVGFNRQGASFFGQNLEYPLAAYGNYGAGNIGALMQATCTIEPASC